MDHVLFPKTLMLCWAVVSACAPVSEEAHVNTATQSQTMPETKNTATPAASTPAVSTAGPVQNVYYPDAIHPRRSKELQRQIDDLERQRLEIESQRKVLMQSPMFTKSRCQCSCP